MCFAQGCLRNSEYPAFKAAQPRATSPGLYPLSKQSPLSPSPKGGSEKGDATPNKYVKSLQMSPLSDICSDPPFRIPLWETVTLFILPNPPPPLCVGDGDAQVLRRHLTRTRFNERLAEYGWKPHRDFVARNKLIMSFNLLVII